MDTYHWDRSYGGNTVAEWIRDIAEPGWIGVDLDGTLAYYDGWQGSDRIGEPIAPMMDRVKGWIKEGKRVKIFTARASIPEQIPPVMEWLARHGLDLEITNIKDFGMIELYDDRCVTVEANTGRLLGESTRGLSI